MGLRNTSGEPIKIVERGSNSNGEYIKFAEDSNGVGMMICYHTKTTSIIDYNGHFSYGSWEYPMSFAETPKVLSNASNWDGELASTKNIANANSCSFMNFFLNLGTMQSVDKVADVNLFAIGRWK